MLMDVYRCLQMFVDVHRWSWAVVDANNILAELSCGERRAADGVRLVAVAAQYRTAFATPRAVSTA